MAEQLQISAQVLQSTLTGIVGLLNGVYSDIATRVGSNAAQYPTFANLKPAVDAVNQGAYSLSTGQLDPKKFTDGVTQTMDALVLTAGQLQQSGVDPQGQALGNANSAKVSVMKSLASIGLSSGSNLLLVGISALGLALAGLWAYKKMAKGEKRRSLSAAYADEEEEEEEEEAQEEDEEEGDPEDGSEGEEYEAGDERTPWRRATKKRLRWSRMSA